MAEREAALAHPALRGISTSLYVRILTLRVLMPMMSHFPATRVNGGEGGIRTPGPVRINGFQDRRFRPLSHLSIDILSISHGNTGVNILSQGVLPEPGLYYTVLSS